MILLSTAYLGNLEYFSKIFSGEDITIEAHENYVKQSYRNRCNIMSAGGVLPLSIPIVKTSGQKTLVKDTRIDYATQWQKNHWKSIVSAYRNSAFFDFFEDDFAPFYHEKYDFLLDYNMQLTDTILRCFNENGTVNLSEHYIESCDNDFRSAISPKKTTIFTSSEYYQVFSDVQPFAGNLSIIDLLFSEGIKGKEIIKNNGGKK